MTHSMSQDDWYKKDQESDAVGASGATGYVYILCRSNNSQITKIGFTTTSALSRANNYTDGEWVIHRQYSMPVWLAKLTERASHQILRPYWLDPKITGGSASEIFTCDLETAENAVELAHLEQLEIALNSLKLPAPIISLILSQHKLKDTSDADCILNSLSENENNLKLKLIEQKKIFDDNFHSMQSDFKKKVGILEEEIEILKNKCADLQAEKNSLSDIIESARNADLDEMFLLEADLNKFGQKKINQRQFESLRDNFRKALELIKIYRIRSSLK